MPRFRKKPIVIEAMQVRWYGDLQDVAAWVNANGGNMVFGQTDPGPAEGYITTLEGPHHVSVGDWIIQGVKGEFYPCKPNIFDMTYEPVES